jgi:nucleotide-binding universal stress UspA family protein
MSVIASTPGSFRAYNYRSDRFPVLRSSGADTWAICREAIMSPARRFHVLIATDGSTPARAALATAVRFPWPAGARGSVVVARQVRTEVRRSILLAALDRTTEATARNAERAISRRWPDGHARVVDASPVEGILDEATRVRADVIVVGWRGHGAVRRLLTGSVSRGVARRARCSVLVVRRPRRECHRLVIGLDGSANAARALEVVAALTPPRGGRVTLVRVVDTMHVPAHGLTPAGTRATVAAEVSRTNERRRASARKDLARAAKALTSAGWQTVQVVTEGAPLRELLATVTTARADALIVGARGVTGLRHLFLGSVAEGAVNASPVPVLIVR